MGNTGGRVTLNYVEQVGGLADENLIRFYEYFAHALTVSVRGIWSDESLSDAQKVEGLKWLNEILHRVVQKSDALRLNRNKLTEADTWGMSQHYVSLCLNISGHIAAATISTYQSAVGYTVPPNNSLHPTARLFGFISSLCKSA